MDFTKLFHLAWVIFLDSRVEEDSVVLGEEELSVKVSMTSCETRTMYSDVLVYKMYARAAVMGNVFLLSAALCKSRALHHTPKLERDQIARNYHH